MNRFVFYAELNEEFSMFFKKKIPSCPANLVESLSYKIVLSKKNVC